MKDQQSPLQTLFRQWAVEAFGENVANDKMERNHRFLEESLELVQSLGMEKSEAYQLVDYVYARGAGEVNQEVGGVLATLACLCSANYIDMMGAGEKELIRIHEKIDLIRAKQAIKPKHCRYRFES